MASMPRIAVLERTIDAKFASAAQLRRQLVLNPEFARLLLCRPREHTDRHAEPVVAIRRRLSDLSA
jgi:hypothetical protein